MYAKIPDGFIEIYDVNDDKVLYELCTRRDCDCLVRFVMQFSGKEVAGMFFSRALELGNSRLTYNLFNYLFMSGNEEKKMILFLIFLMIMNIYHLVELHI